MIRPHDIAIINTSTFNCKKSVTISSKNVIDRLFIFYSFFNHHPTSKGSGNNGFYFSPNTTFTIIRFPAHGCKQINMSYITFSFVSTLYNYNVDTFYDYNVDTLFTTNTWLWLYIIRDVYKSYLQCKREAKCRLQALSSSNQASFVNRYLTVRAKQFLPRQSRRRCQTSGIFRDKIL